MISSRYALVAGLCLAVAACATTSPSARLTEAKALIVAEASFNASTTIARATLNGKALAEANAVAQGSYAVLRGSEAAYAAVGPQGARMTAQPSLSPSDVLSALVSLAVLYPQLAPMVGEVKADLASNDQAFLDADLSRLESANRELMGVQ